MAVAFESAAQTAALSTNSLTFSHTVTAANLLLVGAGGADGSAATVSGVTYNGVALTQRRAQNTGAGAAFSEMWFLVSPATGAHNVVVSYSGTTNVCAGSVGLTGADTTTPITHDNAASGSSTTPSVITTSATGELVVDVVQGRGADNGAPDAGQTERVDVNNGAGCLEMSTEAGAASVTSGWTLNASTSWAQVAVSVQPTAAAADAGVVHDPIYRVQLQSFY